MKIIETPLQGLRVIEPRVFRDDRGFFTETYQADRYRQQGVDRGFVQDNLSGSKRGTLRGLHYQVRFPQAKLVYAIAGEIFDVAVDIRPGSGTFGQWYGAILSEENRRQIFIPEGFAHGFCVLSQTALFAYKCSDRYHPEDEAGIFWADPDIAIQWPIADPILSEKDRANPRLKDCPPERLPAAEPGS